ncbi:hypothetical protein SLS56_008009 [Neofusicoccum ribis]|uniref:Uncharacterized protein n=1 Tax=Neofusicoccum ribis TaxID=45134 RepID=A0ABR3SMA7_9PEZI
MDQSSITSYNSSIKAPSTTPIRKRLPSLSLGPASLPAHVAVLDLMRSLCTTVRDDPLSVNFWVLTVCTVPFNAFPLTLHKDHNEGSTVQFNTLHKVALRSGNSERFFSATRVVYEFVQDESFICFQEDIRHKHLVDVFDFHQILSNRSGHSTYGEAIHGHVKIWRDREPPFHHSISFFGNNLRRDLEFPLLRFSSQTIPKRPEKRVKLSFTLPRRSNEKKSSFRGFMRRSSKSEASTPVADQISDISEAPNEMILLMNELKFLELRFDTLEGKPDHLSFETTFQDFLLQSLT